MRKWPPHRVGISLQSWIEAVIDDQSWQSVGIKLVATSVYSEPTRRCSLTSAIAPPGSNPNERVTLAAKLIRGQRENNDSVSDDTFRFLLALRLEGQQRRLAVAGILLLSVGVTLGLLVWGL